MSIDPISIAIQLALVAASTALQMTKRIEGPKLDDTKFNSGDYGALLPRGWGKYWVTPPVFFGEELKHVEEENKSKGGKQTQHKYFGTWAGALGPHPIAAVLQIELDGHLVFDMTGAGPVSPFDFGSGTASAKTDGRLGFSIGEHLSVYLGSEDQEPDERVLAWTEAKNGTGSCPAYLGLSYLVLKDLPLEKFGNRIPRMRVLVATSANDPLPSENFTPTYDPNAAFGLQFSPDFGTVAWVGDGLEIWDVAARAPMVSMPLPVGSWPDGLIGVYNDGSVLYVQELGDLVRVTPGDGSIETVLPAWGDSQVGCAVLEDGKGVEHYGTYPFSWGTQWLFDGIAYDTTPWQACQFFRDSYGNIWVAGRAPAPGSSTTTAYFKRMVLVDNTPGYLEEFSITGLAVAGPSSDGDQCFAAASGDSFVLRWQGHHYIVDPAAGVATATVSAVPDGNVNSQKVPWSNMEPGTGRIWLGNSEYDVLTGELVRTVAAVPAGSGGFQSVYDPVLHALWTAEDGITIYYLDRAAGEGAIWADVVEDTCALAAIPAGDIVTAGLTQAFDGFTVSSGSGKDWIEPNNDLFDIDPRPHGFQLEFKVRGTTPSVTLSSDDFALPDEGAARYEWKPRAGSTDLPRQVTIRFADSAIDQKPNAAQSPVISVADGAREKTLDLTALAVPAETMQRLAARYHRRLAFDSSELTLPLPSRQIALEPADVLTLNLRGDLAGARLVSIELGADKRLTTDWRRDDPSVATLGTLDGAPADGQEARTIVVPGLVRGFVLDVPLLRDADSSVNPLVYLLAGPFSSDIVFPGAAFWRAIGGEYTEEFGAISPASRAAWGQGGTALAWSSPNLWDRLSVLNVAMRSGSLTGASEAALNIDPRLNLAAYGMPGRWELIQFATAELQLDGSHDVSVMKRGRRGTEWAAALHEDGDLFVILAPAADEELGLSDVGSNLSFKAVATGRSLAGAWPIGVTPFTGASLKPYAPCQLSAVQNATTGAWALSWVRRTRVGGAWTGGASIPLSEASEVYEVEILDSDGTTVKRTYTGLTSPSVSYAVADQVADYGVTIEGFDWRVYQVSDAVGRGFVAAGTAGGGTEAIGLAKSTQWRLRFPSGAVSWPEPNVVEVQMRPRYGASDQCSGGVADASSEFDGSHVAAAAFDNSLGGYPWAPTALDASGSWLRYTFASPVYVAQLAVTGLGSATSPARIVLEYWDGAAWQTKLDTGALTWGALETKLLNVT